MSLKTIKAIITGGMLATFTSCIENDVPYPHIEGVIQEMQVEDIIEDSTDISTSNRTIKIVVGEDAFLDSLPVTRLVANEEASIYPDSNACIRAKGFPNFSFSSLDELPGNANTAIDFTQPVKFLLKTYQDYEWTVNVSQHIVRDIQLDPAELKAGVEPQFDFQNHIVIVYVTDEADYSNIKFSKLDLEGTKTTLEPDFTTVTDFTRPRTFKAYRNGKYVCDWTVDVQRSSTAAAITSYNAWATKVELSGSVRAGLTPTLQYRVQGTDEWTTVSEEAITMEGSNAFSAVVTGLEDGTSYEIKATAGGSDSETLLFQTETITTIPNLNLDTWTQGGASGKAWYPNPVANNLDDPQAYWATGNEGVTSYKDPNTVPVEGRDAYKGKAAKMQTISVALVGAAAGNLFIGTYKTQLTAPATSVSFGQPYTGARITKVSGYYKYTQMPINYPTSGTSIPGNLTMDQCHFYLIMWDAAGNEIAYGEFVGDETVSEYTRFEFDVEYSNRTAKPAKMTLVATSSRYGGEFNGMKVVGQVGEGSTLWVDEFELSYD